MSCVHFLKMAVLKESLWGPLEWTGNQTPYIPDPVDIVAEGGHCLSFENSFSDNVIDLEHHGHRGVAEVSDEDRVQLLGVGFGSLFLDPSIPAGLRNSQEDVSAIHGVVGHRLTQPAARRTQKWHWTINRSIYPCRSNGLSSGPLKNLTLIFILRQGLPG